MQAVVATIVSDADDYAVTLAGRLARAGIRAEVDLRNEKITYKVREHSLAKVPAILVVGKREVEEGTVNLRRFGLAGAGDAEPGARRRAVSGAGCARRSGAPQLELPPGAICARQRIPASHSTNAISRTESAMASNAATSSAPLAAEKA